MEHLTSIDEQAEDYSLYGQEFYSRSVAQNSTKKTIVIMFAIAFAHSFGNYQ